MPFVSSFWFVFTGGGGDDVLVFETASQNVAHTDL